MLIAVPFLMTVTVSVAAVYRLSLILRFLPVETGNLLVAVINSGER
jgi:hypothetical protein